VLVNECYLKLARGARTRLRTARIFMRSRRGRCGRSSSTGRAIGTRTSKQRFAILPLRQREVAAHGFREQIELCGGTRDAEAPMKVRNVGCAKRH
jgi:hypothetical protein